MKKNLNFLPIALSLIMAISFFGARPFAAFAAEFSGRCGENAFYDYDESTQTLRISGSGAMYDYDNFAAPFSGKEMNYKYVVIEDGITSIGNLAFYNRRGILSVTIPDSALSIGTGAFYYCGKLSGLTIPNGVETIGALAFYGCGSLTGITIGKDVKSIETGAFADCYKLKDIYYKGNEDSWENISIAEANTVLFAAQMHFSTSDNSAFFAAIDEARSYSKAYYTKDSVEALIAVTEKYSHLANEEATQTEYDIATAEIINAIRNLDALSDYNLLKIKGNAVFLEKNGFITVLDFEEYTNQFCPALDVVDDGVVNAKDFAYLIKNYSEQE
ncbi:MAG: leucine-rich repeat domain-containing protein [Eubacterium sp.]|nr:leucine-rich repeat domain-containing protein [Eubacterium sp.]